jgi:hypothetical protein
VTEGEIEEIIEALVEEIAEKAEDSKKLSQEESIEILGYLSSYCRDRVTEIRREMES